MTTAECLFNTAVPLTVRPAFSSSFPPSGFYHQPSFFTTSATPVQFHDESGGSHRVNSVVFEIYLIPIVANKKVICAVYIVVVLKSVILFNRRFN
jgi:hypothetical protein